MNSRALRWALGGLCAVLPLAPLATSGRALDAAKGPEISIRPSAAASPSSKSSSSSKSSGASPTGALAPHPPQAPQAPQAPLQPLQPLQSIRLDSARAAVLGADRRLYLEVRPEKGEGLLAFARRLGGDGAPPAETAAAIAAANGGAAELVAGRRYRVPFDRLAAAGQLAVLQALFPADRPTPEGWRHEARGLPPLGRESLWDLAEWFTGNGENFRAVREYNEIREDELARGAAVVIPAELLRPALRAALPPESGAPRLAYGKDGEGDFAVYRLRPGEALYSAVVVRFTGRIHAVDVNALARQIADRSGIADVTDIPVGYRVKIPLDLVQPEYLPAGHPRRVAYELELAESSKFTNPVRARGLEGITVILDAGHGGRDSGATHSGVWESVYVYDIAQRVRRLLEKTTSARVVMTTHDGPAHAKPADSDVLPFSRGHAVLTDPPYPIEDTTIGVHLRWYLANSQFQAATRGARASEEEVVFLSLHADSLHPSLRGAMAYIAGASLGGDGEFGKAGATYAAFREVQENPRVRFEREERIKSEGLSRELAKRLIGAFAARKLAVHTEKPVRDKVIRNQREWVPAVLRYNAVPAKILFEVSNLANDEDRRLIQTRAWRQSAAEALVAGLLDYYDKGPAAAEGAVAAKAAR